MFRGAIQLSMDAKGRLGVPAKHRDALTAGGAGEVVLTAHSTPLLDFISTGGLDAD